MRAIISEYTDMHAIALISRHGCCTETACQSHDGLRLIYNGVVTLNPLREEIIYSSRIQNHGYVLEIVKISFDLEFSSGYDVYLMQGVALIPKAISIS